MANSFIGGAGASAFLFTATLMISGKFEFSVSNAGLLIALFAIVARFFREALSAAIYETTD
jgi:hypothetical protein